VKQKLATARAGKKRTVNYEKKAIAGIHDAIHIDEGICVDSKQSNDPISVCVRDVQNEKLRDVCVADFDTSFLALGIASQKCSNENSSFPTSFKSEDKDNDCAIMT
jgi:hypothetical protein